MHNESITCPHPGRPQPLRELRLYERRGLSGNRDPVLHDAGARDTLTALPATRQDQKGLAMSQRDSSRITDTLQQQYRTAAWAGDWPTCRDVAAQMRGLERDNAAAAEAVYALGFALEMLGERAQAATQYETAIVIGRDHVKARRRLATLRRPA